MIDQRKSDHIKYMVKQLEFSSEKYYFSTVIKLKFYVSVDTVYGLKLFLKKLAWY